MKNEKNGTIGRSQRIYSDEMTISLENIKKVIEKHKAQLSRYEKLEAMYYGEMDIYNLPAKEPWRPDNRIGAAFPKYIVDTFMGYFIGKPVKTKHLTPDIDEKLVEFNNMNNIEDKNFELAKWACIYGSSIELLYQNEDAKTRTTTLKPTEAFIVWDESIEPQPLYGIRYGVNDRDELVGAFYTRSEFYEFKGDSLLEPQTHPFETVPMIEYVHNTERMGIFEPVIPIINQLNKIPSEKSNDVEYFAEAYLVFLGGEADFEEEDLSDVGEARMMVLKGGYDGGGPLPDVKFLEKPNADSTQENLINRLEKWLFQISMVANISDESFGNSSGTSLAYKLQAMSNLALNMQRKLRASLQERYRLFFTITENVPTTQAKEYANIEYTFDRNIPRNLLEESQIMQNIDAIVSKETQLGVFSRIDDVSNELERIETEEKDYKDKFDSLRNVPEKEDSNDDEAD
ncbi:phage portal protein [Lactococcus lactis]|uniref:phage portal protein n=1 Tax=Lactococcus lactis TaxID=1358 RepID=UPI002418320F|nr:phage portal protein [Lactococcus lactis]MDG4966268.1 phage portal protein [Lactococcus lactis]